MSQQGVGPHQSFNYLQPEENSEKSPKIGPRNDGDARLHYVGSIGPMRKAAAGTVH